MIFDDSGSYIYEESTKNVIDKLSLNLSEIKNNGTYYGSLTINYHYASYVQYVFKIEK